MLIDHIGKVFFDGNIICVALGRISFPIFAFFIAEGFFHTSNRKKYLLTLIIFAIISQIPYAMCFGLFKLNVLFTFVISISLLFLIDFIRDSKSSIEKILLIITIISILIIVTIFAYFDIFDYGICGVLLPIILYIFRDKNLCKYLLFVFLMILLVLESIIPNGISIRTCIQLFSLFDIILLLMYNGDKGRLNLKYLFYLTYPLHLIIIAIIQVIIL